MLTSITAPFVVDSRLNADTYPLGDWPLSRLLLFNDCRYDWLVLVPRVAEVTEWVQLSEVQQEQLWRESRCLSEVLLACSDATKLNIGALGNVVSQLHIHHVMRHHGDAAWPGPVWGHSPAQPYSNNALAARAQYWREQLRESSQPVGQLLQNL
ncbi:MAG: HIT domain-containing protein [Idiomarina sp.]